jgi:hypothetical protein
MQSAFPQASSPGSSATKQCRKCRSTKPLGFFPRDRSRPDGRWHTCKLCNQRHGQMVRATAREQRALVLTSQPPPPRQRLGALKAHREGHRNTVFEQLPRTIQQLAMRIYHKALGTHVQRYGFPAPQPKRALLWACAVSNAQRVGDNSWSRRMKRLKGWRRQRQRELLKQLQAPKQTEHNPTRRRAVSSGAGYTPASRLAGI